MSFTLPSLDYAFNALEPHIDARTMEIHHGKHHQAYVTNLNNAIVGTEAEKMSIEDICRSISKFTPAVRNNGGGHFNHSLFWSIMSPSHTGVEPTGEVGQAILKTFHDFARFKEEFAKAGVTRFGSGWAWLIVHNGQLTISSTPNQDNPLMDVAEVKGTPILCLDVWEHAYYLHYQNRRPDYITAWWNLVNWTRVNDLYLNSIK